MARTYEVVFATGAQRALRKVPERVAHACIAFIMGPLAENPYRVGKPLMSSWEGHYSARRGEWRVIYVIDDDRIVVEVVAIAHRGAAYRPR
ncbi:hypothetical protein BJF85_15900 [Saccharomonospora sp. CUA-673]|uniref:type II toxin-antitoxin system RelE family toxin n=1 Tax=Saccharomonospora sp. CUA-673 TaxID=1904969 RepID=UPI00095BA0A2|nr:type II toxin-antitoxin system RelE/ParE family toxin [Saccharomonospora sp. CUA-673]OLT46703.1 hypothetical protein BJF85_15900 [Saccharomonospora sp. CUA-673]